MDFVDSIEVTKTPTPDTNADSIGGAINLKSRSALNRKGRHAVFAVAGSYNVDRETWRPLGSWMQSDSVMEQPLRIMITGSCNQSHKPRGRNRLDSLKLPAREEWEVLTNPSSAVRA